MSVQLLGINYVGCVVPASLTFASSATSTQPLIVQFLNLVITEFLFILL